MSLYLIRRIRRRRARAGRQLSRPIEFPPDWLRDFLFAMLGASTATFIVHIHVAPRDAAA